MPIISIIIPFYNTKWVLIKKCINSIIIQDFSNYEVIIINDGSTDESLTDKCYKYISELSNFKLLINDKNYGVSYSRNRGIEESKGKFVLFIDADDWINSNMLFDLSVLVNNTQLDTIFFDYNKCFNSKTIPIHKKLTYSKCIKLDKEMLELMITTDSFNSPCCIMYSKLIIDKYNLRFREDMKLGEDYFFNTEYLQYYAHGQYIKKCYYNYYYNSESATNTFSLDKAKDTGIGYFLRKNLLIKSFGKDIDYERIYKEFYKGYIKSIFSYMMKAINDSKDNVALYEFIKLSWVCDVIDEAPKGVKKSLLKVIIFKKRFYVIQILSKLRSLKQRLKKF